VNDALVEVVVEEDADGVELIPVPRRMGSSLLSTVTNSRVP
jgi:hypothetical protein